ncbi:MAG: HAMP domain-containing sensor histidine kinase [Bacteroidota bacterium]
MGVWLCLIFNFIASTLYAQGEIVDLFQHRQLGPQDGIGRGKIGSVVLDERGFYWFCSSDGMYRFDGRKAQKLSRKSLGVPSNRIFDLAKVGEEIYYFESGAVVKNKRASSLERLTLFDPVGCSIKDLAWRKPSADESLFGPVIHDDKLLFWNDSDRIYCVERDSVKLLGDLSLSNGIDNLVLLSETNELAVLSGQQCYIYDLENLERRLINPGFPVYWIYGGSNGLLLEEYVETNIRGEIRLHFYSAQCNSFNELSSFGYETGYRYMGWLDDRTICMRKGSHLIGLAFDESGNLEEKINLNLTDYLQDIQPNNITSINGDFWFLSHKYIEVVRFVPEKIRWIFREDQPVSVRDMAHTSDSVIFVNSYRKNRIIDAFNFEPVDEYADLLKRSKYYSYGLAIQDDHTVIGGMHGLFLQRFDLERKRIEIIPYDDDLNNRYSAARLPFVDYKDQIWVGTNKTGLARFNDRTEKLDFEGLDEVNTTLSSGINGISEGLDLQTYWLATDRGAFLFDVDKVAIIDSVEASMGSGVAKVRSYSLDTTWILPNSGDPYLCDRNLVVYDTLPIFDEFTQNNMHDVIKDAYGKYWFSTNCGLFRYDPKSDLVNKYTKKNSGLPFDEFNREAALLLEDGRILFGGVNGIIEVDPSKFSDYRNGISADGPLVAANISIVDNFGTQEVFVANLNELDEVKLNSQVKSLILEFSHLDLFNQDINYYFRIDDGSEWVELDEPIVTLTELSYGKNQVELGVSYYGQSLVAKTIVLNYNMARPWYLYPASIFIYLLLSLLFVSFLMRRRVLYIKRENSRLEKMIALRTEDIRREQAVIKDQNEELNKLTEHQQRLFSLIAHELQSPLVSVSDLSEQAAFLMRNKDWELLDRIAKQLEQRADSSRRLLTDLLDWGRAIVYQQEIEIKKIIIKDEVDNITKQLQDILTHKRVSLSGEFSEDLYVFFDPNAFSVIVRNLIHNAIKFSPIEGVIQIKAERKTEEVVISVSDQGMGLSNEQIDLWENRKRLVTKASSTGDKGSGIGLNLARVLAEQNTARIEFVRNMSSGSMITFSIPVQV